MLILVLDYWKAFFSIAQFLFCLMYLTNPSKRVEREIEKAKPICLSVEKSQCLFISVWNSNRIFYTHNIYGCKKINNCEQWTLYSFEVWTFIVALFHFLSEESMCVCVCTIVKVRKKFAFFLHFYLARNLFWSRMLSMSKLN